MTNLSLLSDEGIADNSNAGSIAVANLNLDVDTAVDLSTGNDVDNLAVAIADASETLAFGDVDGLRVGTVDGTTGITTNNAQVDLTTGADETLTIAEALASGGGAVNLTADKMAFTAAVNATGGTVTLKSATAGDAIDLGSGSDGAADTLELSDTELDRVTAGILRIGATDAGAITVSAALTPTNVSTSLSLLSDEGIADNVMLEVSQ